MTFLNNSFLHIIIHSVSPTSIIILLILNPRYEIFMDVVKPDNLNIGFLREFMMLPTSYYEPGAALKFRKFNFTMMIF